MKNLGFLTASLLATAICGVALFAGTTSAMPGWSHPGHDVRMITETQREQIRNLHDAYRAALSSLDWTVDEDGHSAETMQQARELRIALRAEIVEVLRRGESGRAPSSEGSCPWSGKSTPVKFRSNAETLYL